MLVTDGASEKPTASLYELMGGDETVTRLVEAFYRRVKEDPHLSPIFPADLTITQDKQYRFLSQFFGGPRLYAEKYGHPRLRARHLPFPITPTRARAWLSCMAEAMAEVGIDASLRSVLLHRLALTAVHMVNTPEEGEPAAVEG